MQLTRAADYAVRVMIHLASLPAGARASCDVLASAADVPSQFLGKVLQSLARARLIASFRGVQGGFALARPARDISLLRVVEAIEGPIQLNQCLTSRQSCGRRGWCAAHRVWQEAQAAMLAVLEAASLAELAQENQPDRLCRIHAIQAGGCTRWN